MKKIFLYINKKPKSVRDNYALGIATAFTSLVLFIWLVASPGGVFKSNEEISVEKNSTTPFSTLISESKEKISQMKDSISQTSKVEDSQTASAANSSSSNPSGIILNDEDLELLRQNSEQNRVIENKSYNEVMIATTTNSTETSVGTSTNTQ